MLYSVFGYVRQKTYAIEDFLLTFMIGSSLRECFGVI